MKHELGLDRLPEQIRSPLCFKGAGLNPKKHDLPNNPVDNEVVIYYDI